MNKEDALVIWNSINELFKLHGVETSFFYENDDESNKVEDGYYDFFYFEFNLDRNTNDKALLGKISTVLCLPELEKYSVRYSKKDYLHDNWRFKVTLFSNKS